VAASQHRRARRAELLRLPLPPDRLTAAFTGKGRVMNLDQALHTFVTESRELLEDMETALLAVEQARRQDDLVNAIFRAAHTIKGSAGLFDLDHVVAFTHVVESVLDHVRDGHLAMAEGLVVLLLAAATTCRALIEAVAAGQLRGRRRAATGRRRAAAGATACGAAAPVARPLHHGRARPVPAQALRRRPTARPAARTPTAGTSACAPAPTCCATAWTR
jgi:chemotaxis protein histidine kinase CheA